MNDKDFLHRFALPESAVNSQGLRYNPMEDVWWVSSPGVAKLDLSFYRGFCTAPFFQSLKLALVTMNWSLKPTTMRTCLGTGLRPLIERMGKPIGEIGITDLEAYWFALPPDRRCWFHRTKAICASLALHGIPGHSITPEALSWLKTISPGDAERGEAVRTWDPVHGPLTPDELDAFIRTLHASFARAEITTEDYILVLLFASFGARNSNLSDLKICDLKITKKNGITQYELDIPRVKQRGGRFRQSSYTRKLISELGVLIEGYIETLVLQYENLSYGDQIPFFVNPSNLDPIRSYHRSSQQIRDHTVKVANRLDVPALRTGKALHVNPRRFRSTVATLARAMGLNPSSIAVLLDHCSTRTQEIYAAISPAVLAEITKRLGGFRNPLAAAFLGRVAEPGEIFDPQKLVFRARFRNKSQDQTVGGCEASKKCGGRRPYVCYQCALFTASIEGDHQGALEDVLQERVRFDQEAGDSLRFLTADSVANAIRKVIASVQVRLEELGKTLERARNEKEALLRMRGVIS